MENLSGTRGVPGPIPSTHKPSSPAFAPPRWKQEEQKFRVTIVSMRRAWAVRQKNQTLLWPGTKNSQARLGPQPPRASLQIPHDAHQPPVSKQGQVSDPVPTTRPFRTPCGLKLQYSGKGAELDCPVCQLSHPHGTTLLERRGRIWKSRPCPYPRVLCCPQQPQRCWNGCAQNCQLWTGPRQGPTTDRVKPLRMAMTQQHRVPQSDHILSHSHPRTLW